MNEDDEAEWNFMFSKPFGTSTGRKFGVLFYFIFFFLAVKIDNQEERIDSSMDILRTIVNVNVYNFECIYLLFSFSKKVH